MTAQAVESRRSRITKSFGPGGTRGRPVRAQVRAGLAVMPVLFCLAHYTFGANQPVAALWLTVTLGLALIACLASPLRTALHDIRPLAPLAILFVAVLGIGLWSLTPWGPGGPHPLWSWAEVTPGSLTIDRSATTIELVKLTGLAAVFLVGALHGARRDHGEATIEAMVWTGGVYAAISLLSFLAGGQIVQSTRLSGGFLSANSGATVFGLLTVLGLAIFLRAWRRKAGLGFSRRITAVAPPLACLALTTLCLLLTASRMGGASTLVAVAALLAWESGGTAKGRLSVVVSALLMLGLAVILVLGGNALLFARVGEVGTDLATRAQIFSAHWDAFLASPLFGYGLGTFDAVNLQIMTADTAGALWFIRATHNVYLQWLEEAGLVGALPMFVLVAVVLGFSLVRARGGRGRTLQHGLVCANLVVLLHALTDYALQTPSIAAFWTFLLGLQFAFGRGRSG